MLAPCSQSPLQPDRSSLFFPSPRKPLTKLAHPQSSGYRHKSLSTFTAALSSVTFIPGRPTKTERKGSWRMYSSPSDGTRETPNAETRAASIWDYAHVLQMRGTLELCWVRFCRRNCDFWESDSLLYLVPNWCWLCLQIPNKNTQSILICWQTILSQNSLTSHITKTWYRFQTHSVYTILCPKRASPGNKTYMEEIIIA